MRKIVIEKELGARPSITEIEVVDILVINKIAKKSVTILAPKNQNHIKTPDIVMDGQEWEIKSPTSAGKRTIEAAFRQAIKQSPNIIFDLRGSKTNDEVNLSRLKYVYKLIRGKKVKNLLVITKTGEVLDLNKTS